VNCFAECRVVAIVESFVSVGRAVDKRLNLESPQRFWTASFLSCAWELCRFLCMGNSEVELENQEIVFLPRLIELLCLLQIAVTGLYARHILDKLIQQLLQVLIINLASCFFIL